MYNFRIAAAMGGGAGLVALLFALPSALPPAIANEEPARTLLSTANEIFPPPFDPSSLVKWDYTLDGSVNATPVRQSTVKKIGYGNTEIVHILQTPSGTYSTDALQSPNVEYPGVLKHKSRDQRGLAFWLDGDWVRTSAFSAGSFVTVTKFDGGQLVVTEDGMCVVTKDSVRC